jgi:hypothetical protein
MRREFVTLYCYIYRKVHPYCTCHHLMILFNTWNKTASSVTCMGSSFTSTKPNWLISRTKINRLKLCYQAIMSAGPGGGNQKADLVGRFTAP